MIDKWDSRFLELANSIATWSKDPSRGVGAVSVSPRRQVLATGYNGLPRGVEDHPDRLERPVKYDLTGHAEMNASIQCARNGRSPVGTT
nr:CMP deaminase [Euryarchaeota archaeon]